MIKGRKLQDYRDLRDDVNEEAARRDDGEDPRLLDEFASGWTHREVSRVRAYWNGIAEEEEDKKRDGGDSVPVERMRTLPRGRCRKDQLDEAARVTLLHSPRQEDPKRRESDVVGLGLTFEQLVRLYNDSRRQLPLSPATAYRRHAWGQKKEQEQQVQLRIENFMSDLAASEEEFTVSAVMDARLTEVRYSRGGGA